MPLGSEQQLRHGGCEASFGNSSIHYLLIAPKAEQTIPRFQHKALNFKALSKQVFCLPCIGTQDQVIRMVMLGIRIVYNGLVAQANASP